MERKASWPEALRPGRMRLRTAWVVAFLGVHALWFSLGFYARLVPGGERVFEWFVFAAYLAAILATPLVAARKYREWFPWGAIAIGFAYAALFLLRPPIAMHPAVALAVVSLAVRPSAACPDCGALIRRGDPRCNHCGEALAGKWKRPSMFSTGRSARGGAGAARGGPALPPAGIPAVPRPVDPSAGGRVEVMRDAPAAERPTGKKRDKR